MAKKPDIRLKVLKLVRQKGHRYDVLRAVSQAVSLGILVVVPLTGLARVDLWGGAHRLLFKEATFKEGLAGVIIGIGAMYVVTFLSNVVAGRMFCGWGCPVGQVSRFGEAAHTPGMPRSARWKTHFRGALFSAVFVISVLAWWVDLRVLWMGTPGELGIAWGLVAVGIVGAYAHARWWRWDFCKSVCPIGLYYSFVSPAKWYGVYFRNQHDTCIECNACDNVCPVDLTPRDLMKPIPARAGVSIGDAPGRNHCLECGDCVRACEKMIDLKGEGPVPLLIGYHLGPQRIDKIDAHPSVESSSQQHEQVSSIS